MGKDNKNEVQGAEIRTDEMPSSNLAHWADINVDTTRI